MRNFSSFSPALQAGSQTKQFHFFALCPAIFSSPSSALFASFLRCCFFSFSFFLVGQVGNEKSVSFLVPGQSGSNLFLFSFPHIHSAATFCLKATLSQEHSLRPLLSDERGENREREKEKEGGCHCNQSTILQTEKQ